MFQKCFEQDSYTTKGHCKSFMTTKNHNPKDDNNHNGQWSFSIAHFLPLTKSMHMSHKNKSRKNLEPSYSFSSQMNWILKHAKTFNTQNAFKIEKTHPFCLGQLPNSQDIQFNKEKSTRGGEHIVWRILKHNIMWKFNPRNLISPIGNTRRLLHWFKWRRKNTLLHLIKGIFTTNSKQILMFSWWKKIHCMLVMNLLTKRIGKH